METDQPELLQLLSLHVLRQANRRSFPHRELPLDLDA